MATVRKSAIVAATCERLFDLVDECERYPEFLPWCEAAEVVSRDDAATEARLRIAYRGLKTAIATRNRKARPHSLSLDLVEGPFEHFQGRWTFAPLGAQGCRVDYELEYRFAGLGLESMLGPLFGHIAGTLVESFVRRAEEQA